MVTKAQCPLCTASADFEYTDFQHFKFYVCPTCGDFEISAAAERLLSQMAPERARELSRLSQSAGPGMLLSVRRPIAGEAQTGLTMIAKLIPREQAQGRH